MHHVQVLYKTKSVELGRKVSISAYLSVSLAAGLKGEDRLAITVEVVSANAKQGLYCPDTKVRD